MIENYIDLHTHTTASDGQYSPAEVVKMAKEKNIELLAITDHDTISGLDEAIAAAKELDLNFIPGIEISTHKGVEIHMLGYGVDPHNPTLLEKCVEYEESRSGRAGKICDYLNRLGIPVDLDEVRAYAGEGSIGRPHFAQWLQEHGIVRSRREAFERFLTTPRFLAETERVKPSPEEAIALIHEAGGIAVLAHPGLIKFGKKNLELLIKGFKEAGLDGVECIYSKHEKKQEEFFIRMAKKYELDITAGSDYHGDKVKPEIGLGMKVADHLNIMSKILEKTAS